MESLNDSSALIKCIKCSTKQKKDPCPRRAAASLLVVSKVQDRLMLITPYSPVLYALTELHSTGSQSPETLEEELPPFGAIGTFSFRLQRRSSLASFSDVKKASHMPTCTLTTVQLAI